MKMRVLGNTGIKVSELCLGTLTLTFSIIFITFLKTVLTSVVLLAPVQTIFPEPNINAAAFGLSSCTPVLGIVQVRIPFQVK